MKQGETDSVRKPRTRRLDPLWLHIKVAKAEREAARKGGDALMLFWKHRALRAESKLLRAKTRKTKRLTIMIFAGQGHGTTT